MLVLKMLSEPGPAQGERNEAYDYRRDPVESAWLSRIILCIDHHVQHIVVHKGQNHDDELRIVDDEVGSPTFTEDVLHQLWVAIEDGCCGTYHRVNTGAASWYELASRIDRLNGSTVPVTPITTTDYPTAARRPSFSALSDRHLELEHLKTMRSWQDALEDCMEGYKEILQHG